MCAWIATRTGVQLPSPPFSPTERKWSAVALAEADEADLSHAAKRYEYRVKISVDHVQTALVCNFLAGVKNKASHDGAGDAITTINPIDTAAPAFMNYRALGKVFYHSAILLACVTLSCRPQQAVILSPGDTDLVVLNGCVISACNY